MNCLFFALVCGMGSLTAITVGQANSAHSVGATAVQEPRYGVYWLTKMDGESEYRMLLITRMPLPDLAELVKLHGDLDKAFKGHSPPQLLEQPALTIATYKKDSIWNDGVPLKPVTRVKKLMEGRADPAG